MAATAAATGGGAGGGAGVGGGRMAAALTTGAGQQVMSSAGVTVSLSELNPHFVCVLCFGYFVDATTITECMHTFCKSCIVNFLRTKRHCPRCDTHLTKTRPYNSLRPDRVMQALVFKTVPGLFQMEMRRRIEFYQSHPHADYEQDVEDFQHYVFSSDDSVSLAIRYYNFRDEPSAKEPKQDQETKQEVNEEEKGEKDEQKQPEEKKKQEEEEEEAVRGPVVRYFRCPATVPVAVLKTLVKTKYRVPDPFRVELLYGDDRLLDSWTLMEVAYIYMWKREAPMELSFQVVATRKVRKRRQQSAAPSLAEEAEAAVSNTKPPAEEPPDKVARLEEEEAPCTEADTAAVMLSDDQTPMDTRPPTPPETPEGGRGREGEQFPVEGQTITDLPLPQGDEPEQVAEGEAPTLEEQQDGEQAAAEEAPELQAEMPLSVQENGLPEESPQPTKEEPDAGDADADSHRMEASEDFDASKESNELIVDHDSETPLEVDTSHETEPEGEGEGDCDGEQNGDGEKGGDHSGDRGVNGETDSGKHCRDDEQEDSAIDVTENSASEPMDSDDKDTDLNVSTESTELEEPQESSTTTREVQTDEGPINLSQGCRSDRNIRKDCYVFTDNEDDEDECGDQEEERDEVGALDLSRHARSVREARTQRESLESPPSDGGKGENRNARGQGTQTILSITQSKKSKKLKQQAASTTSPATPTAQTASIVAPITRPPMPLDWAVSPLVPTPVNPSAVGFHDLMTLSHAAVQLQLMAHHAQAQARAQAEQQARAQAEQQARAQAQVLKNLKSTESLSFVNGSGDTLTISPITTASPEVKANKTTYSKAVTKSHHTPKTVNGNSYSKSFSHKSHHTHKSGGGGGVGITNPNNKVTTAINHGSIRTTIPKSALTASLKIPNVSSVSSKTNGNTCLSTPKHDKDHPERTGDPVFKITNQKLAEFVRRQHQEQKMKQRNNNFKSSTTTTSTTTTTTTTTTSSSSLSSSTSTTTTTCPSKPHSNTSTGLKVSPSVTPTATSLSSAVSRPPTGSSQSIRATNTSVRQIPNPSLLRQQSESRITSGLTGLGLGSRRPSESISRIESLTRSLHEKVAASSLAATINSAAR